MSYEFRATAEDRTRYRSLWLGSGMKMPAPTLPHLKYFDGMKMMNEMMKMNGDMKPMEGMEMSNQTMDMNKMMYPEVSPNHSEGGEQKPHNMDDMDMHSISPSPLVEKRWGDEVPLNYGMLRSPFKTTWREGPTKVLHFD